VGSVARGDAIAHTWTWTTFDPQPVSPASPGTVEPTLPNPAPTTAPHADTRYMAFTSTGSILVANDGGIYQVTNPTGAGGLPPNWSSLGGTLQTTEQYDVALDNRNNADPTDDVFLSAAQDNGTEEGLAGTAFTEVGGGDGVLVIADAPGGYRYYSAQNFSLLRRDPNGQLVVPPAQIIGTGLSLNGAGATGFKPVISQGQVYLQQLLLGGFVPG